MLGDWGARENYHLIGKIATCIFPKKWCPTPEFSTNLGRIAPPSSARRWRTTFFTPRPLWSGALTGRAHRQSTLPGVLGIGVLPYNYSGEFKGIPRIDG